LRLSKITNYAGYLPVPVFQFETSSHSIVEQRETRHVIGLASIQVEVGVTLHAIAMGTADERFTQQGGVEGCLPQVEDPLEVHSFCQVAGHRPEMTVRAESAAVLIVLLTAAEA